MSQLVIKVPFNQNIDYTTQFNSSTPVPKMVAMGSKQSHVLVLPHPAQGHINPMLQFAKRLASKGITVSLVVTHYISKSMESASGAVGFESISDGFDIGGRESAPSSQVYMDTFKAVGSQSLRDLIHKLNQSNFPVSCVVFDSFLPWALDVAKSCGILAASFLTQSCAVDLIYYHVSAGNLSCPPSSKTLSLPGLPQIESNEIPSFVAAPDERPGVIKMVLGQLSNLDQADFVLCNTFSELETNELRWMRKLWPVIAIGPTVPSMYLDNRVEGDKDYGLSLWKKQDAICNKWLQDKETGSVVYVSFGSMAKLSSEQMEEIAWALQESKHYFLWVVRATEESKLPPNFVEVSAEKGLVVSWAAQLDVLGNKAVGCFVTHCGWNSTLEGLCLGVPMVCVPHWSDQPTNAKYIEQVWGVGVRAAVSGGDGDEGSVVGRVEVKRCIEEVMEGEGRERMLGNAKKWRELAVQTLDEGGSSDRNIEEFVAAVRGLTS